MSQLVIPSSALPGHRPGGEVAVALRDGELARLRPLRHGESDVLLAVFARMSAGSRALRYLTPLPEMPRRMREVLADVDGVRHVAWLASIDGEPAGIARCIRLPTCPTTAELAVEVVDDEHGRGLATALTDAVTTVADALGVRRIRGTASPSNPAPRRLLERLGASGRIVQGLYEAEGRLRLLDPATVDRAAVLALARPVQTAAAAG